MEGFAAIWSTKFSVERETDIWNIMYCELPYKEANVLCKDRPPLNKLIDTEDVSKTFYFMLKIYYKITLSSAQSMSDCGNFKLLEIYQPDVNIVVI